MSDDIYQDLADQLGGSRLEAKEILLYKIYSTAGIHGLRRNKSGERRAAIDSDHQAGWYTVTHVTPHESENTTMLGSLTNQNRVDWRTKYQDGETVDTYYKGAWRKGTVTGHGPADTLKVTVLADDEVDTFKDRVTTQDVIRKAS